MIGTHIFEYIHKDDQEEMSKILGFTSVYGNFHRSMSSSSLSECSLSSNEGLNKRQIF